MSFSTPRITIVATRGGSGKTLLSLGIARCLANKGMKVIPFKKGPDYIDAAWLAKAAGQPCYNLDPYLMSSETILNSFCMRGQNGSFCLVEGNRGLFDGVDEQGSRSSAELAKLLSSPVILVMDATKATRTMAALALGCKIFDPDLNIAGIVLNNIANTRHKRLITTTIEQATGIPVLGAVHRLKEDPMPMRHLGITPYNEYENAEKNLKCIAAIINEQVNMEAILKTAASAPAIECAAASQPPLHTPVKDHLQIGILRDAAFQFYYPENLEALEKGGAELVFIDAISQQTLPPLHALYIGGGFPETQAVRLSQNLSLMKQLSAAIENGLPVYAECGGLMYLGRHIHWKGMKHLMLQVIDWDFILQDTPVGHGYCTLEIMQDTPFYKAGTLLKGHEFHYSRPVPLDGRNSGSLSARVVRGHGFDGKSDGLCYKNIFGTYLHIHALSHSEWALGLLQKASDFAEQTRYL